MSLGVHLEGVATKRGLIPRVPAAARLADDLEALLATEARDALRSATRGDGDGAAALTVALHPAAEPLEIAVRDDGSVSVHATTSGAGPGYHTYVGQLLRRVGATAGIDWQPRDAAGNGGPGAGHGENGSRTDAEQALLGWLRGALVAAAEARARAGGAVPLSLPAATRFDADGALATPLGPRDDDWLARALADPAVAIDVWPWWADATDARYLLNRALCLMWTEIRWRSPAADERPVIDEVLGLLRRAHAFEPSLDFPWTEWAELASLRGDDRLPDAVTARAAQASDRPPIGYRRRPVTIVHEGWSITVPGTFAERRTAEEVWAGEAGRSVTLAAVPTGAEGRPMSPTEFLDQVAGHLGPDALDHRDGPVIGRARLAVDGSSGVETAVLEGYSAVVGSGAAVRITWDDPADWGWALETWRDLTHP